MKRLLALFLCLAVTTCGIDFATAQSSISQATGTTRWTFAAVTMDGSSDTLRAAAPNCAGIIIANPSTNSVIYVDISGGTAAITRGLPLAAGTWMSIVGQSTPCNAVTAQGTNTNIIQTWTGL